MESKGKIREEREYVVERLLLRITDLLSEKGLVSAEENMSIKKVIVRNTEKREAKWKG